MEDAEDAIDDFAEIIENIGDKLEQGKCERILILILIKNNGYNKWICSSASLIPCRTVLDVVKSHKSGTEDIAVALGDGTSTLHPLFFFSKSHPLSLHSLP